LSAKPTTPIFDYNPGPAQDLAPEQKLVAVVKGLKVMDSQDTMRDKLVHGATAATKRKKIVLESDEDIEAEDGVPLVVKNSSPVSRSNLSSEKKDSRSKGHNTSVTIMAQSHTTILERPKRACVSTKSSARKAKTELTGGEFWSCCYGASSNTD
jgi:hypothetical protein